MKKNNEHVPLMLAIKFLEHNTSLKSDSKMNE